MIYKTSIILLIALIGAGCACKKNQAQVRSLESVTKIEEIACKKFNNDFEIQYNHKRDYALVQSSYKHTSSQIRPHLSYFVYSVRDKNIIIEDSLKSGNIIWSDKYSIFASEKEQKSSDLIRSYKYDLKKRNYRFL
jgi:hypothetical protein